MPKLEYAVENPRTRHEMRTRRKEIRKEIKTFSVSKLKQYARPGFYTYSQLIVRVLRRYFGLEIAWKFKAIIKFTVEDFILTCRKELKERGIKDE